MTAPLHNVVCLGYKDLRLKSLDGYAILSYFCIFEVHLCPCMQRISPKLVRITIILIQTRTPLITPKFQVEWWVINVLEGTPEGGVCKAVSETEKKTAPKRAQDGVLRVRSRASCAFLRLNWNHACAHFTPFSFRAPQGDIYKRRLVFLSKRSIWWLSSLPLTTATSKCEDLSV